MYVRMQIHVNILLKIASHTLYIDTYVQIHSSIATYVPVKNTCLVVFRVGSLEPLNLGKSRFISDFIRLTVVWLLVTTLLWVLIRSPNWSNDMLDDSNVSTFRFTPNNCFTTAVNCKAVSESPPCSVKLLPIN